MKKIVLFATLLIFVKSFSQETSFFNADGFFSIGTQSNRTASITFSLKLIDSIFFI